MSAHFRLKSVLLALTFWPGLLQARPPADLGDPPTAPTPDEVRRLRSKEGPIVLGPGGSFSVNIASREQVRNFFNTVYAASANFSIGWTGDL